MGSIALVRRPGFGYYVNNFSVQIVSLNSDSSIYTGALNGSDYEDIRFKELVPKIEMAFQVPVAPVKIFGAFAYVQADGENLEEKEKDFGAMAYHIGSLINPKFGDFYGSLAGYYSVNGGLYGMLKTGNGRGGTQNIVPAVKTSGSVEDANTWGGTVKSGYIIFPQAAVEIGAGYQISSSDAYKKDDDGMGVYGNVTLRPNRYIMITPEISYMDYMKRPDGSDDAKLLQVGAQLRLDI